LPVLLSGLANAFDVSYTQTVTPIFYESDVFIVPKKQPNTVVKHTLQGATLWDITLNGNIRYLTARFNQLFILDSNGDLTVYNTVTGMRIWDIVGKNITSVSIQYPNIVYLSRDQKIGRIYIDDGVIDWELPLSNVERVKLVGHSDWVLAISDEYLYRIGIATGKVSHQLDSPHADMHIKATFNSGAILSGSGNLYHMTIDPFDISKTLVPGDLDVWTQEKYRISYSDTTKSLTCYDDENHHRVWSYDLSFSLSGMHIQHRSLLMVSADTGLVYLLHLTPTKPDIVPADLISFNMTQTPIVEHYHYHDRYYVLTKDAIISRTHPNATHHEH
jgi:hypothetical protein